MEPQGLRTYLELWESPRNREENYERVSRRISTLSGASHVEIRYQEPEKPRLLNEIGWHFNLSHSGELVCCAYSTVEVGLDVECYRSCDYASITDYWFRPEEQWQAENVMNQSEFFRLWTQKEAWLKLHGKSVWEIGDCPSQNELSETGKSFTFNWNARIYSVSYCLNME